jgi:predicted phage tail protein
MGGTRDTKIADANQSTITKTFGAARKQIIQITDLLSEGPIEGLVDGLGSIYLNDDAVVDNPGVLAPGPVNYSIQVTNGSTSAKVIPGLPDANDVLSSLTDEQLDSIKPVISVEGTYNQPVTLVPKPNFQKVFIKSDSNGNYFTMTGSNFDSSYMDYETILLNSNYYVGQTMQLVWENGIKWYGRVDVTDASNAKFYLTSGNNEYFNNEAYKYVNEGLEVRLVVDTPVALLNAFSGNGIDVTLSEAWPAPSGTYDDLILSATFQGGSGPGGQAQEPAPANKKYNSFNFEFRTGERVQAPVTNYANTNAVAFTAGPSFRATPLEFWDTQSKEYKDLIEQGDTAAANALLGDRPQTFRATDNGGFGLTPEQIKQVDEIRFNMGYQALYTQGNEDGKVHETGAKYKVEVDIYRGSNVSTIVVHDPLIHKGKIKGPMLFEELINLEPFKPFTDFTLRVQRLTRQEGQSVDGSGNDRNFKNATMVAGSQITGLSAIIKEPLTYPFTAYANISFDSKDFNSPPTRTYELRGMKIKVPSNYITREENDGVNALYEGYWDGSFRPAPVYCNNPAWVFYDIITNNRYGLGDWIKENDIDKYALYRIARYCDSLVQDGKGGFEPRFTSNIYLTKAVDAYKILKDIASIFTGLVYWADGQIVAVADSPGEAVYSFTRGNVIDGLFKYQTTGAKTKSNQVIVSWNNPEANYILEPLIVEDRVNIVEENRVIQQQAAAFGATSEGQAQRFGRYKLYTAQNQQEIVSFSTSINASFLRPGDIIQIQDGNRTRVDNSGRILESNGLNLTLDRNVVLEPNITYEIGGLITTGGAFLAQQSATINSTSYSYGELLPIELYSGEVTASAIEDDDGEIVAITWSDYSFVETRTINFSGSQSQLTSDVSVTSPFTAPLIPGSVWAIKRTNDEGQVSVDSPKLYKILGIEQDDKTTFAISAVEHYNEKFDSVENNYTVFKQDEFAPPLEYEKTPVPAPSAIWIATTSDPNTRKDEFKVQWLPPKTREGGNYGLLAGFQIDHNVEGYPNPIEITATQTSYSFSGVEDGTYYLNVKTVNTLGRTSPYAGVKYVVDDPFKINCPRAQEGLAIGGAANKPAISTTNGVVRFDSSSAVSITPIGDPTHDITVPSNTSVNLATLTNLVDDKIYYILATSQGSNPLRLIDYYTSDADGLSYWYDVTDANTALGVVENTFTSLTGTVSIARNSMYVRGIGTSFTTEVAVRDKIRIEDATNSILGKVVSVVSDTVLVLDRISNAKFVSAAASVNGVSLEYEQDCIIASILKNGSNYTLTSFLTADITATKENAQLLEVTKSGGGNITYGTGGTAINSTFDLVIDSSGYTDPEYKVTGDGFNYVDESPDTAFISMGGITKITRTFTLSDTSYNATSLVFDVEMRDGVDTGDTSKVRTKSVGVDKVQDSSDFITGEINDLTDAVVWANVPAANITELSVTQHEAALSITESQISDFGTYLTSVSVGGLSDTSFTNLADGEILAYNATSSQWENVASITETDPVVGAVSGIVKADGAGNISAATAGVDYLASFTETDPIFSAHTTSNISNGTGFLVNNGSGTWSYDNSTYLTSESDPVFSAHTTSNISNGTGFLVNNGSGTWSYDGNTYLTSEHNDLSTVVTWANVPDANITQSSVTQHEAALSITESQISDLGSYLENIVEDTSPQLGGNLAGGVYSVTAAGVVSTTGLYVGNSTASVVQDEIRAEGNITAFYSSDLNLKENISRIRQPLKKLNMIAGYTFDWKDSEIKRRGGEDGYFVRKRDIGVIAQEIESILPELVAKRENNTLAVKYEGLIPLLIEAIKELEERVKELENGNSK